MGGNAQPEQVLVRGGAYIYRVQHRIMEGDCQFDHGPRAVATADLYFDKYPVTNERFKRFLDDSGYRPQDDRNFLKHWRDGVCPERLMLHPVVWVSLADARAYASWAGGRLPRDGEWQWAAGGPERRKWPWGNMFDKTKCNAAGDGTTPVNLYPEGASPFGLMDMCGNAWEWMEEEIDDGEHRFALLRGGSHYKAPHMWHAEGGPHPTDFHLKFPLLNEALNRCETVGFRCVKEDEQR